MDKLSNWRHGRRTILVGAGAALGLGGLAASSPGPVPPVDDAVRRILPARANSDDGELIALCEQFSVLQAHINDYWEHCSKGKRWCGPSYIEDEDERDAATAKLTALQWPIMARICALQPRTLEGFRSIARSLALWDGEVCGVVEFGDNPESADWHERLVATMVRGGTNNLATVEVIA